MISADNHSPIGDLNVSALSGPVLITETKFMQQYRVAAGAHGGGDIAAICNRSGDVEVFTTGTDGTIWNYYPDPASDTGYSSVSTGMVGSTVAAGVDSNGRIVLFASNNLIINYVVESDAIGVSRWDVVQTAQTAPPVSPLAISQVYPAVIDGTLYVGVLTRMSSAFPGHTYSFSYSDWNRNPGVFKFTPMTLSTLNCVWTGSNASTAEFTCLDQTYLGFEIATHNVNHYAMAASFTSLSVSTVLVSGKTQYFAVLNDGNLYELIGGNSKPYSWAQVTQGMAFREVIAILDANGHVQLLALSTDTRVYHVTTAANERWTDPIPILSGQAVMTIGLDNGGNIELFLIGTAQAALTRMIMNEATGDWETSLVEVPTSGQVEEFISYSTDITITDAAGAPLPNVGVQIYASAQTQLSVNGSTYLVDPHTPANLTSNAAGRLSVTQPTSHLCIPTLEISVHGQSLIGQNSAIRQFAGVQDQLATVSAQQMMDAKDANGIYILEDQYRTLETTTALARASNECMKLPKASVISLQDARLPMRARKLGVGLCPRGRTADLNRIGVPIDFQPWHLNFSNGNPAFRSLDADQAQSLLLARRAQHLSAEGVFDFIGSIGDFVSGIGSGLIDVVDAVVSVVGNAVSVAITFLIDGVSYLFSKAVEFIEEAFDLVEVIFAKVKLFFKKVFEWLGFLFAWNDILRTQQVYIYTANQFLTFVGDAAGGIQRWIDAGFGTAQGEIDLIFDQLIEVVGVKSSGAYINSSQPSSPTFSSAANNNIVLNATLDNVASSVSSPLISLSSGDASGLFDPIITALEQLVLSVSDLPQWQQALAYITNLGGSVDNMFQQLLSALLRIVQGIIKAVLLGVQVVVDALLQSIGALIAKVQQSLNEEWNIPFVSTFYSWLTDSNLTTLDLLCLILAIPATVTYKAIYSSAPFPDSDSVQAFKSSFNAQAILTNSGFGAGAAMTAEKPTSEPSPGEKNLMATTPPAVPLDVIALNIGGMFSTWIYGVLSAIIDVTPVTGNGVVAQQVKTVTKWAFALEVVGQAIACPWISSSGPPSCADKDGGAKTVWIVETVNIGVDAFFVYRYDTFAQNNNTDVGVIAGFMQGVGHCVAIGITGKYMGGWGLAGKIAWVVAELVRPLRLSGVATATGETSLVVMAAFDVIGFGTSGICSFVDAIHVPSDPPSPQADRNLPHILGAVPSANFPT